MLSTLYRVHNLKYIVTSRPVIPKNSTAQSHVISSPTPVPSLQIPSVRRTLTLLIRNVRQRTFVYLSPL